MSGVLTLKLLRSVRAGMMDIDEKVKNIGSPGAVDMVFVNSCARRMQICYGEVHLEVTWLY